MLHGQAPLCCLLASLLFTAWPVLAADKNKPASRSDKTKAETDTPITLNFVNADIEAVARTLAGLTRRTLVVDPRVKGTLSLTTDKPVPGMLAWNQFLAVLRLQGFAVIETQGLYKLVPEAEAKLQGGQTAVVPSTGTPNNAQVMTQIFKLNHENANNLVAVLRPLISANNTINVTPGSNALVITDYADNLQRMGRIIASLDVANATDVEVIPLQHTLAADMAVLLGKLLEGGAAGAAAAVQTDTGFKTSIQAEPRSNTILLRSPNPARQAQVRSLIDKLDRPSSELAGGNIHVVYLKNADATKLANTLRAAIAANGTAAIAAISSTPGATAPGTAIGQPTTGGQIQADPSTNSLVITAAEPQFRQLRAVIDALDQRRAQVLVESLIVEVDSSKEAQFGIQWQNAVGNSGGNIAVLGTNFGTNNNLLSISTSNGATLPGAGLNIGTARNIGGSTVMTALANFLQSNGGSNILSRPSLLTLDNEEAKIVVGQNVSAPRSCPMAATATCKACKPNRTSPAPRRCRYPMTRCCRVCRTTTTKCNRSSRKQRSSRCRLKKAATRQVASRQRHPHSDQRRYRAVAGARVQPHRSGGVDPPTGQSGRRRFAAGTHAERA